MPSFFYHFFFPQESNNYRPKILHIKSIYITICLIFILTFGLSYFQAKYPQVLGAYTQISFTDLLNFTNQARLQNNLPPLSLNSALSSAAEMKGADMFAKNYWAHNSPDGLSPWYFFKQAGYDYVYAGENLARGFTDPSEVVSAWMASPEHRANILSRNFSEVGFSAQD